MKNILPNPQLVQNWAKGEKSEISIYFSKVDVFSERSHCTIGIGHIHCCQFHSGHQRAVKYVVPNVFTGWSTLPRAVGTDVPGIENSPGTLIVGGDNRRRLPL